MVKARVRERSALTLRWGPGRGHGNKSRRPARVLFSAGSDLQQAHKALPLALRPRPLTASPHGLAPRPPAA